MRFGVVCLAVCLLGLARPASPQSADATIEGLVRERGSGAPMPGIAVEILRAGVVVARAETDDGGGFAFSPLLPGRYLLRASLSGYLDVEQELELEPRDALALEIEVSPAARLEERVEVRAAAPVIDPQRTGSAVHLGRDELDAMPAPLSRDVPTLAENALPGAISGHDNFVHVRGNELSLHQFLKGVSFLDNPHQHFLPGLSPRIFESVNLVTGGFRAEFGNRFGGILDIITRSAAAFRRGPIALELLTRLRLGAASHMGWLRVWTGVNGRAEEPVHLPSRILFRSRIDDIMWP